MTYRPGRDWKCSFSTVKPSPLDRAGDDGVQVGPLRQRLEAEHVEELLAEFLALRRPVLRGLHVGEAAAASASVSARK